MIQLPDDILLYIIQCLPLTSDLAHPNDFDEFKLITKTLANLCLTSRSLRLFSQPLLYRTFIKDAEDLDEYKPDLEINKFRELTRMQQFIRTLIERPDLAARVESMRLEHFQEELLPFRGLGLDDDESDDADGPVIVPFIDLSRSPYVENSDPRPIEPILVDLFERASHIVPPPDPDWRAGDPIILRGRAQWQDRWRADLRKGVTDAEMTLMMALVTNIRVLDVFVPYGRLGLHFQDLCSQLLGPRSYDMKPRRDLHGQVRVDKDYRSQSSATLPIFSRLESIRARTVSDEEADMILHSCSDLLTVPTLKFFSLHGSEYPFGIEIEDLTLPLDHILHLNLEDCCLDNSIIESLINSCGRLQSLKIKFGDGAIEIGDHFLECLTRKSDTLETLSLTMSEESFAMAASPFDLCQLENLKSLKLSQYPLLPQPFPQDYIEHVFSEIFPPSIQELSIHGADNNIYPELEALYDDLRIGERVFPFPELRYVEVLLKKLPSPRTFSQPGEDSFTGLLGSMKETFEKKDIEFSVLVEHEGTVIEIEYT